MAAVSLDTIREDTEYRDFGHYIMIKCPYHDDHKPSMMVSEKRFICFSCGQKGSLPTLHAKLAGIPLEKKQLYYGKGTRIFPNYENLDEVESFCYHAHKRILEYPIYKTYLKQRKIESAIKPLKLGYHDGWYTIPIYNKNSNFVGAVGRAGAVIQKSMNVRFTQPSNQKALFYVPDWTRFLEADKVYITFGIMDAISLWVAGYASATGTVGKDKFDPDWVRGIRKPIYFVPDKNEYQTAFKHASKLGWRGKVLRLDYGQTDKDPNDLLQAERLFKMEL